MNIDKGLVLPMAFPRSMNDETLIYDYLKIIAKDSYFNVVEFGYIESDTDREKIRRLLDSSKLRFSYSGHSLLLKNNLNINSLSEIERLKAVEALKVGIDQAYELGAESFSFLSNHFDKDEIDNHIDSLVKSTKELCEYSKSKGNMNILLEVFDSDVDKKSLIGYKDVCKKYVDKLTDSNNFGIMIDLSHFPLLNESIDESVDLISDYIKHVHIGNAVTIPGEVGYGDMHPRFGFPNSSNDTKDVYELVLKLNKIGYFDRNNIITFEVRPQENEDSEIVIANAKRTLNEALAMIEIDNEENC